MLKKKLKFLEILDEMKNIERAIILKNWKKETDAEHSYDLAFMVMLFWEDFKDKLNLEKCYKMALLHDIVEIYAWDTLILDKKMEATKEKREKDALVEFEKSLWKEFFKPYKEIIEEYENKNTLEAKFVNQIDKLQPVIQIANEWWTSWLKYNISKEEVFKKKRSQIDNTFWFRDILEDYINKVS